MERREYKTLDRGAWASGPWDDEPDKVQWPDPDTGLPCLAVRNAFMGHWCGYVGVAEGHPKYGKEGDDLEAHGGVNFAGMCMPGDESHGVCHVPSPGEPEHVWWLGFDCAHAWDASPYMVKMAQERGYPFTLHADEAYRTLDYVKAECARLAQQLKGAE